LRENIGSVSTILTGSLNNYLVSEKNWLCDIIKLVDFTKYRVVERPLMFTFKSIEMMNLPLGGGKQWGTVSLHASESAA
jgi:hypothetical protein